MTRTDRTVADRQQSLQPAPPEAHFTLAGARRMHAGLEVWPESHWPGFALRKADVFQSDIAW